MAFPIVTIYYGLAIILSILFYNYADEQTLIAGKDKLYETIDAEKTVISSYSDKVKDTLYPYVEEYYGKLENYINPAAAAVEETADQSALFANEKISSVASQVQNTDVYKTLHKITETVVYQKIAYLFTRIYDEMKEYFTSNPQYMSFAQKTCSFIHEYSEIIYNFFAEKLTFIANQEPIKGFLAEYGKLHDQYVTPYVEQACDFVSGYTSKGYGFFKEQTHPDTEAKYTFLVVVVGVFIAKYALTSVLRYFAKDAFQMSKSMSEMYKQQQKQQALEILKNNDKHSDVYIEIKEKVLDDFALTKDEVEELEAELEVSNAGSNRTRIDNTSDSGSNRTRTNSSGSNRSIQELEQHQQEEQQENEGQEKELSTEPTILSADESIPSEISHLLSDIADASSVHTTITTTSAVSSATTPSCLIFTPGHVHTLPVASAATSATESLSATPTTATTTIAKPL